MSIILVIQLVALLLLVCCSGFFSSAEVSFFSMDPHQLNRISESDPVAGKRLQKLLASPTRLLSTILIGNTIVNTGLTVLGFTVISTLLPGHGEWLSILILTLFMLVFGEFAPKRLALLFSERLAIAYAPPMGGCVKLLSPFRAMLERITESFRDVFHARGHILSDDEFKTLVEVGNESGSFDDDDEHTMVRSIIHLESLYASNVMTPRVDIQGIDLSEPDTDILEMVKEVRYRFVVLYREQLDDIVGTLDVTAFLLDPEHNLERATRQPYFIPEQCSLDKLLSQFTTDRQRSAIVVDEYGGTAGLITRGDLLEELTGDMIREGEDKKLLFEELTPSAWLIDANMSIEDVNRRTGLSLSSETADRLAGWFIEIAEHLPRVGEMVRGDEVKAMVRVMRRQRILQILIEAASVEEH